MSFLPPDLPVVFLAYANERTKRGYLRQLTTELKQALRALEPAVQRGYCQVRILPAASSAEIAEVFQDEWYEGRIQVFHYSGHADEDELWLEGKDGGNQSFFSLGLARFLGSQKSLKLVFLNACATGEHADLLMKANIPAVIGTSTKIDDSQAMDFASTFYRGLASGASVEEAFGESEGMQLGKHGPEAFKKSDSTRSLYWEGKEEDEQELDFPWRLFLREQSGWVAGQWRLFHKKVVGESGEFVIAEAFVGEQVQNYEILDFLGQGNVGSVFRVRHTSTNAIRAMKITHHIRKGYDYLRQVMVSGNLGLAAVRHPNVVEYFDIGEVHLFGQKRLFVVMELVEGARLDHWSKTQIGEDPDDFDRLREVFLEVCSGVKAVHEAKFRDGAGMERQGLVHGNIRTRKILFAASGTPKLIDFMFADLTRSGQVSLDLPEGVREKMATEKPQDYLAPEIINGTASVGKGTDLYALGAVLFEVIKGQPIGEFAFRSVDEIHQLLREKNRVVPRYYSAVINKALQADPADRYAEVGELMDAIEKKEPYLQRVWSGLFGK